MYLVYTFSHDGCSNSRCLGSRSSLPVCPWWPFWATLAPPHAGSCLCPPGSDALALLFRQVASGTRRVVALIGRQLSSALRAAPCPAVLPEELLSSWYNCYKRFGFLIATLSPTPTRTPTHSLAARPRFMSNYVADCVKLAGHANTASTGQRSSTRDRPRFVCANVCTNCLSPDKRLPGAQHGVLLPAWSPFCLWRVSFIVVWFCFAYDLHEIRFARLRLRGPDRE